MLHDLEAVLAQARVWHDAGARVALATVVRTWGSSPRPAGSKLAVNERGEFVGSVSGGCIEAAVIHDALEVMAGGAPRVLDFGVSDETAWEVGLACGGKVEVYVEAVAAAGGLALDVLDALIAARRDRRSIVLATALDGSGHRVLAPADAPAIAARDQAEVEGGVLFEPQLAPLRLIIVGAVHVADALARLATIAGFAVTTGDPRRGYATAARCPDLALVLAWPDAGLTALAPDARTAIVTLTHDPKLDDPALVVALASPAFYVGCLGSHQTHAARRARLVDGGVAAAALDRLHGPVGLRIGARTPAEIAVSILAEIVATLRGPR